MEPVQLLAEAPTQVIGPSLPPWEGGPQLLGSVFSGAGPAGAEAHWLDPGERLADRYRIEAIVGSGGVGVVYRALDERLGIRVALKVLRPELTGSARQEERFRRELVLARQVSHRNAVRIHDIGRDGGTLFLTMDLVEGRSLREVLQDEIALKPGQAVAIARQLALALEAAHEAGIVHRDLKPGNVLVDRSNRAWITDFGVACSRRDPGFTLPGSVVGTLAYLSPEQARGLEVDGRSDLFALGILLFEMLTGDLPFAGGSATEVIQQHITGNSRDLKALYDDTPAWLAAVVHRLLQPDPGHRFQTARELIDVLDRHHTSHSLSRTTAALILPALLIAGWFVTELPKAVSVAPVTAAESAPLHTLALLPLADSTGRQDLGWVARGLPEMLALQLQESPSLQVVDNERVLQTLHDLGLAGGSLGATDLQRLSDLFHADLLVTGSLTAAGSGLRAELSLSGKPGTLPTPRLQAAGPDVYAIAGTLERGLRERLGVEAPTTSPPRASPDALRLYQRGIDLRLRGDDPTAVSELRRAVALDPGLTPAWIHLARLLSGQGRQGEALAAAHRAVAVEGTTATAVHARALELGLAGRPDEARKTLERLAERLPHDIETRIELAEAAAEAGDLDAARTALQRVVAEDPRHPQAWFLLAKMSILAGDSRRAADNYLVRALKVQSRLRNEAGRAEVLNACGIAWQNLGAPERALESYSEAAEIRRRRGDGRGYAATLRNMAAVYMVQGEHEPAAGRLEEALAILGRLDDPAGLADLHNDLGLLQEEMGRYPAALEHYRQALQLRRPLGRPLAIAESLRQVGWASYLLGRYDDAAVYWSQSLEIARRGGDQEGMILGRQDLGMLQIVQGDWNAAMDSFMTSLRESRKMEMANSSAAALGQIGRVALLQGNFRAALSSFKQAQALLRELEDVRGQVELTLAEAEAQLESGDPDVARERMDAAERWLAKGENREQSSELLRLRAEWSRRRGEAGPALRDAERAVSEAAASGAVAVLLDARITRARLRGQAALPELRELSEEADRLGHRVLQLHAAEALIEAALAAGKPLEAEDAARRGLRTAESSGTWMRSWRLHQLLSESLLRLGRTDEAASQLALATVEVDRLRDGLVPQQRASFEPLQAVQILARSQ